MEGVYSPCQTQLPRGYSQLDVLVASGSKANKLRIISTTEGAFCVPIKVALHIVNVPFKLGLFQ